MKKQYEVFSMANQPAVVEAVMPGGVVVNATVDSLEVQLVALDRKSGTIKLVFTDPSEIADAKANFFDGQVVEMNVAAA